MLVIARSAPEVLVVAMEIISFAVAGLKVVEDRLQKPTVPEEEPVILPEQVKLPVELATVQPVAPDPPAIVTSTEPSDCKAKAVAAAVTVNAPPAGPVIEAPSFASTKVMSPTLEIWRESVPLPTSSNEDGVVSPIPTLPFATNNP